jgi:hypothetical protein
VFLCSSVLQIAMTYKLVAAATFETLNLPRMRLIAHDYIHTSSIPTCKNVQSRVSFTGEWLNTSLPTNIIIGRSIHEVDQNDIVPYFVDHLNYHLSFNQQKNRFCILLTTKAEGQDILKAIFHAAKWKQLMDHQTMDIFLAFQKSLEWTNAEYPFVWSEISRKGWLTDYIVFTDYGTRIEFQ